MSDFAPVNLGMIGCGSQALEHYIRFLKDRVAGGTGVRLAWISGFLPSDPRVPRIDKAARDLDCDAIPGEGWRERLGEVDAVLVSLPNNLHGEAIRVALTAGKHVAVDKPTTICPNECAELVQMAKTAERVFVTVSQRRHEEVYRTTREIIERGGVGNLAFAQYLISHHHFDRGRTTWTTSQTMAGGGSLMQSGYHGLDTLLWMLRATPAGFGGSPTVVAVSAECRYEVATSEGGLQLTNQPPPDGVETVASLRLRLSNSAIFELTASYANPIGSVDEVFKIVGDRGMIRFNRERPVKVNLSAGDLSYQDARGVCCRYVTADWSGNRTGPVADFLDAVQKSKADLPWSVLSPAADSVETLRVIRAAYRSAAEGGREISVIESDSPRPVHHVAVQTGRYREALRFYTEILGMRVLQDGPFKRRTVAWLQAGNTRIELFSNREGDVLVPWNDRFAGPIHLAFEVENLNRFLAWAEERGARLHPSHPKPFVPPVIGAKPIAYLLGPDGEEVEVRERD